jgi:hypothetical protein
MTDPDTNSGLVTVNLPNGGERHLKKLAPSDWVKLANTLRTYRKAEARAWAKAGGAKEEEVRKAVDAIDRRPVRHRDVEAYVNDLGGQQATIILSLQKDNPDAGDAEFDALGIPSREWVHIVAGLLDLEVYKVEAEGTGGPLASGGGEPPSTPSGTSKPTPTESGPSSSPSPIPGFGPSTASTAPVGTQAA